MGDVSGVAAEGPLGVQREGDGHGDVDKPRVLQQERRLRAATATRLAAGDHHRALGRGGLVQAMLQGLVLRHAEVQLVEAQQERVPVLGGGRGEGREKTRVVVSGGAVLSGRGSWGGEGPGGAEGPGGGGGGRRQSGG